MRRAHVPGVTLALLLAPVALAQSAAPAAPVTAPVAAPVTAPVQVPVPVTAPVTGPRLTLAQALSALQQAPGWRSAALQYLSASQSLDAARARAGLSLSVGADLNASKTPIDSGDWSSSTTLSVQAGVNVLPWSSTQAAVVQAQHALYRAGLDQRVSQNTLALAVVQGYLSAKQAAAALKTANAQLALAARQLEVARAQQAAGVLTLENLLTIQASQEQASAGVADAQGSLDTALRQLYNTLGTAAPAPGFPDAGFPELSSSPTVPVAPAALDTLLAKAATGRSEVLKALSSAQDAQLALDAARLDRRLPDVSLNVQYGQLGGATGSAGPSVSSGLNFKTGQLTAGVSVPFRQSTQTGTAANATSLALGLSGSYAVLNPAADVSVQSAQTALASAGLALSSARSSAELDVRQKYAALQNALLNLTAPRTTLTRTQTALQSAQVRQQAGLSTALDVQQAQVGVLQAQNTLDSAVAAAYLAALNLSVSTAEFSPALIQLPDAVLPEPTTATAGGQP